MALIKENIDLLLDKKFVKVYDLKYEENKHYYVSSRRSLNDLVGIKSDLEFKKMLPDAVSIVVVIQGEEDKILLTYEHRYTTSHFLLSVPAGLIDEEDKRMDNPLVSATIREMYEETGLKVKEENCRVLNRCLFSSPGLTDEANGMVLVEINEDDLKGLTFDHITGDEQFSGFIMYNKEQARKIINQGVDENGNFFSVYVMIALQYFINL